jgi:aminopeptidase N
MPQVHKSSGTLLVGLEVQFRIKESMKRILWGAGVCAMFSSLCFGQRLPRIAVPNNYHLTFAPDFAKDNFVGLETIQVQILQPTSKIVLHAADINFEDASISSGSTNQKAKVTLDETSQTATLSVDRTIEPGRAAISIRYTGILNDQLRGFYLGREDSGQKYAGTQLEATDARRAFPSFDEPEYKATFDIAVIADQQYAVISNAAVVSDRAGPGEGKHTVRFATTAKMSCYLVAIVVGNFEYMEGSADGIPIRVYTVPGKKKLAGFALETAKQSIRYFNQYFGIRYPFGKLDLIGLPDFAAGAMENTGAILSRETSLLVDEQNATFFQKRLVAEDMAHEIAHQWFGDLVTMKWWDDAWLNEGFATWMQTKSVAVWKPELNVLVDDVLGADAFLGPEATMDEDSLLSTHPVHQPAETPGQILELFDPISYGKAAGVLWMLESYLGPETFRKGVHNYLQQHAYGSATSEDFWSSLTAVSNKPVTLIMSAFINQAGLPLVSIETKCRGNITNVTLSQQRYFADRSLFRAGSDESWPIPICMKAGTDVRGRTQQRCVLLSKKQESVTLSGCASWVMGNVEATGYYRTNYDPAAVRALSQSLETVLTPSERIRLLGDEWASVRVGRQSIEDYLELVDGLRAEKDTAVIDMVTTQLGYIGRYLVSDRDRASYERWVRSLLAPLAQELGWHGAPGEGDERKALRAQVLLTLGATARDPEVLEKAGKLVKAVMEGSAAVDAAMADAVFQLAAINGDAAFYEKVLDHMKRPSSPEDYKQSLSVLETFEDPALLDRTLKLAMTGEVRAQDAFGGNGVIVGVMANPAGERLAWDFVREHWEEIEKKLGGYNGSGSLVAATSSFCDPELRDQVKDFFSAHHIPDAERTLRQSLEHINNCMGLRAQQSRQLASWIVQQGASEGK